MAILVIYLSLFQLMNSIALKQIPIQTKMRLNNPESKTKNIAQKTPLKTVQNFKVQGMQNTLTQGGKQSKQDKKGIQKRNGENKNNSNNTNKCEVEFISELKCLFDATLKGENHCKQNCVRDTKKELSRGSVVCPAKNKGYIQNFTKEIQSAIEFFKEKETMEEKGYVREDGTEQITKRVKLNDALKALLDPLADCQIFQAGMRISLKDYYSNVKDIKARYETDLVAKLTQEEDEVLSKAKEFLKKIWENLKTNKIKVTFIQISSKNPETDASKAPHGPNSALAKPKMQKSAKIKPPVKAESLRSSENGGKRKKSEKEKSSKKKKKGAKKGKKTGKCKCKRGDICKGVSKIAREIYEEIKNQVKNYNPSFENTQQTQQLTPTNNSIRQKQETINKIEPSKDTALNIIKPVKHTVKPKKKELGFGRSTKDINKKIVKPIAKKAIKPVAKTITHPQTSSPTSNLSSYIKENNVSNVETGSPKYKSTTVTSASNAYGLITGR
jgi:hypothetical protein